MSNLILFDTDILIDATAILLQAPFVSKNQKDFHYIEGLNLLAY